MDITPTHVEAKIREIYPEIGTHGLAVSASFEEATGSWLVRIAKGADEITTHIDREDAEACLAGRQCVKLAAQVGNFVNTRCSGTTACVR